MTYRLRLCEFTKRNNETATPSSETLTVSNVLLKEGSDLHHPVITAKITGSNSYSLSKISYFYFEEEVNNSFEIIAFCKLSYMKNLYNNIYEIAGDIDVLGHYKTAIGGNTVNIDRCSDSNKYDERQYDDLCNPTSELASKTRVTMSSGFSLGSNATMSVMGFNGQGMEFYASRYTPQAIANEALDTTDIASLIEENLGKANDYFTMAKVYPFRPGGNFGEYPDSETYIGTYYTVCKGGKQIDIDDFSGTDTTATVSRRREIRASHNGNNYISTSAIVTEYNDFRRYDNRYTQIVANCPFVGMVDIDPIFLNFNEIHFVYYVDILTGIAELSVYAESTGIIREIGTYSCRIGIDVPICNYNTNWMQITTQIKDQGAVGVIKSQFNVPTDKHTLSNLSGFASYVISSINIECRQLKTISKDYKSENGIPTNKRIQINTLASGTYLVAKNPSITGIGHADECEQINNLLASGIYWS